MSYSACQDEETRLYKLFIDKVKGRVAIPRIEYYTTIDNIAKEHPEIKADDVHFAILNHGWHPALVSEGNKSILCMVKPN